ncbi:MAG TPA: SRPBCC family protein, partial [Flavobacterium sp.]|nr:SRPBCC family protein [Flavobacterium sp.]
MRIVKYVLLLLLLILIGLSVYVATQPGEYEVERSRIIKAQRAVVFNYVNDYKNWEDFSSWKDEDPQMAFAYPDTTIGKGASYSWKGKYIEGTAKTTFEKENDSIAQKTNLSGNEGTAYLTFKDVSGGTKITWHSKGKLNFMAKAFAVLKGGASQMVGDMQEKTLEKLDKIITYEMNTYSVKV